jgi:hypothetical protein
MAPTQAAKECVMSCNNRKGVASGVLCGSVVCLLLRNCVANTSLQLTEHATVEEVVFAVGASLRLYDKDLMQPELE